METAVEGSGDRLETILNKLITETNRALLRMEKGMENLHQEMIAFKNEMKGSRGEKNGFKERMELGTYSAVMGNMSSTLHAPSEAAFVSSAVLDTSVEGNRVSKQWIELVNKWGTIVEDIIAPAIPGIAGKYFGFDEIEDFSVNRWKKKANDKNSRREFDVIAVCGDKVLFCEVRTWLRPEYIDDFIEFLKKEEFFEYFPLYKDKQLLPIFSSYDLAPDIVARLSKHGIFAMAMNDSAMDIVNYEECNHFRGQGGHGAKFGA